MRKPLLTLSALGALAVAGCGGESGPTAAPSSAAATSRAIPSVERSAIPDSYRYVLESSCGLRGLIGGYRVVVRDGVVASVENLNDDYPYEPAPGEVPTLAGLVERAESAEPEAVVDLVLDGAGLPRSLSIDHVPAAVDDEECYEVSEIIRIP